MIGLILNASAPTALLMTASPSGQSSGSMNRYLDRGIFISTFESCPLRTQRNSSSWGPCFICPENAKSASVLTCEPCLITNTSWCFRAAIEEIEMGNLTSHVQAYPYPESSDSTEYDDLLLSNMFQLSTENLYCLLLSPIFWAMIGCLICTKSELKQEILKSLGEKYLTSITQMHWVASYLEPTFKSPSFVTDKRYLEKQRKEIRKGIHILASQLISDSDCIDL